MAQVVAQCGDIVVSAGPRGDGRRREERRLPAAIGPVALPGGARCGRRRPGDSVAPGCFCWAERLPVGRGAATTAADTVGRIGGRTAGRRDSWAVGRQESVSVPLVALERMRWLFMSEGPC